MSFWLTERWISRCTILTTWWLISTMFSAWGLPLVSSVVSFFDGDLSLVADWTHLCPMLVSEQSL